MEIKTGKETGGGRKYGNWTLWFDNGQKSERYFFRGDSKDGKVVMWSFEGNWLRDEVYLDQEMINKAETGIKFF